MIYLFVWERYFRQKLINTWKKAFEEKYSIHNIIHVKNILDYELLFYEQNLLSSSFFASKNLFIIDDFPYFLEKKNDDLVKIENYFLNILPKIIDENIVIFNVEKIDKRSKIFKELEKYWEIKDFTILNENDLKNKLNEIYDWKISTTSINKLIELKWQNFSKISNEIDKLLISKDFIDIWDLKYISKDIEENIFEIINDILNLNKKEAILKLRELNNFFQNFYLIYNMLVSNFRVYFYIFKLKTLNKTNFEIEKILNLWNRSFLISKKYNIDYNSFLKFYENLISLDEKLKTWKMIWNDEKDLFYELEKVIII